jgi:hypothetical protein
MKSFLLSLCAAILALAGCARVYVPPAIDLKEYEVIGLIEFGSNAKGDLPGYVTQKFIEAITEDQDQVKIVELGDEKTVLEAVGKAGLGPDAYRAIADKYNVKTVLAGDLKISEPKTSCNIGPGLDFASIESKVSATLTAKLFDSETGATLWSNSGRDERTVAGVSKFGSSFTFDAEDPDEAYGDLARHLCRQVTRDFRATSRSGCCGK